MQMFKDRPVQLFLDELASKASTPGGGSAAAVMGAMGAALVSMVANFTIGKKGYEDHDAAMRAALSRAESLRTRLTDMIRADVEAFNQVMAAYGLPKETEADKSTRNEAIQSALKAATEVPLECARACVEAIELSRIVAEQGNRNVISDAGVAVLAVYAALRSAALNVYVNAKAIKDPGFVQTRLGELEQMLRGADATTERVYQLVKGKL
ncbi:MAG: methenyltetrahydrofolate cyclohydrolase [Gammaproteobacteria bacterium]